MAMQTYTGFTVKRGTSFSAYLLEEDGLFSPADYKLLVGQGGKSLLQCISSRYNGKQKLTYFTDGLMPLSACVGDMLPEQFVKVIARLISVILGVDDNGFLDIQKLDMSFDAFYLDMQTYAMSMIYLPIRKSVSGNSKIEAFNLFCQSIFSAMGRCDKLKKLIRPLAGFANTSMGDFNAFMTMIGSQYDIEDAPDYSGFQTLAVDEFVDSRLSPPVIDRGTAYAGYIIAGDVNGMHVSIPVKRTDGAVVVGKSRYGTNYVIYGVPTVSNKHCEFRIESGMLMIKDLNSTNGTFVNGRKLRAHEVATLSVGDTVSLSNVVLKVSEVS